MSSPRRRLIRRGLVVISLSLILGVTSSILIAAVGGALGSKPKIEFGEAIAAIEPDGRGMLVSEARISWAIRRVSIFRGTPQSVRTESATFQFDDGVIKSFPRDDGRQRQVHAPPPQADIREEYQVGWAMACLWGAEDSTRAGAGFYQKLDSTCIVRVWPLGALSAKDQSRADWYFPPPSRSPCRFLATGILARGLAINTCAFAALWAVPLLLGPRVRRHLRLRRNHCPKCNYNLCGLAPGTNCPECGHTPARPRP